MNRTGQRFGSLALKRHFANVPQGFRPNVGKLLVVAKVLALLGRRFGNPYTGEHLAYA